MNNILKVFINIFNSQFTRFVDSKVYSAKVSKRGRMNQKNFMNLKILHFFVKQSKGFTNNISFFQGLQNAERDHFQTTVTWIRITQ